jgi:SPOR domain
MENNTNPPQFDEQNNEQRTFNVGDSQFENPVTSASSYASPSRMRNINYLLGAVLALGLSFLIYRTCNPKLEDPTAELNATDALDNVGDATTGLVDSALSGELSAIADGGASVVDEDDNSGGEATVPPVTVPPVAKPAVKTDTDAAAKAAKLTAEKAAADKKRVKLSTKPTEPAATASTDGKFLVQAGVFSSKANADAMLAKVLAAGLTTASISETAKGFLVGARFDSKDQAKTAMAGLKTAGLESYLRN